MLVLLYPLATAVFRGQSSTTTTVDMGNCKCAQSKVHDGEWGFRNCDTEYVLDSEKGKEEVCYVEKGACGSEAINSNWFPDVYQISSWPCKGVAEVSIWTSGMKYADSPGPLRATITYNSNIHNEWPRTPEIYHLCSSEVGMEKNKLKMGERHSFPRNAFTSKSCKDFAVAGSVRNVTLSLTNENLDGWFGKDARIQLNDGRTFKCELDNVFLTGRQGEENGEKLISEKEFQCKEDTDDNSLKQESKIRPRTILAGCENWSGRTDMEGDCNKKGCKLTRGTTHADCSEY